MAKRKKQAFDGPRKGVVLINPFSIIVLGVDTSDPPTGTDLALLLHKHRIAKPFADGMLNSISTVGVEKPITVAKVWLTAGMELRGKKLTQDEQHEIVIDGRRRVRHARELARRNEDPDGSKGTFRVGRLPPKTGMSVLDLAFLANDLNEHQEQDSPIEKAAQARLLIARSGDETRVSRSFGWGIPRMNEMLKLLGEGSAAVHEAIGNGDIKATPAAQLTRLSPKQQDEVLKNVVSTGRTSTTQVRGLVMQKLAENAGTPKNKQPSIRPTMKEIGRLHDYIANEEYDDHELNIDAETVKGVLAYVHKGIPCEIVTKLNREIDRKDKERAVVEAKKKAEAKAARAKARAEAKQKKIAEAKAAKVAKAKARAEAKQKTKKTRRVPVGA